MQLSEQIRTYDFDQVAFIVLMILAAVAAIDWLSGRLRFAIIGRRRTPAWPAMTRRGTLVLLVGPSGAGKDSILAGAATRLGNDPQIIFARRLITRPANAGGEDHIAVSPAEFAACRDAGGLMLYWNAHGLDYGLPSPLATTLDEGKVVVANVSRTVVEEARRRFAPMLLVAIAASSETLAARLAARGREDTGDIAARLARGGGLTLCAADLVIDNDGPLDDAVESFVAVLRPLVG